MYPVTRLGVAGVHATIKLVCALRFMGLYFNGLSVGPATYMVKTLFPVLLRAPAPHSSVTDLWVEIRFQESFSGQFHIFEPF